MIKKNLQLLEGKPNIFEFPQSTINTYKIDELEKKLFISSLQLFLDSKISKTHFSTKFVNFHIDNDLKFIDIVKISKYPLTAAYNSETKRILLNLSAFERRSISNIEPKDLYALLLYGHVCGVLSSKDNIPKGSVDVFSEYMSAIFLKIFARKFGITGSYVNLIPYLRFLVSVYIHVSFFGFTVKQSLSKAQTLSKFNIKKLDIDLDNYDFSDIKSFISVLNDSQIMPGINTYKFVDTMIRQFGVINLPLFEDLMRCCSTLFASTVNGNNYFSPAFQIIHGKLFDKLVEVIDKSTEV